MPNKAGDGTIFMSFIVFVCALLLLLFGPDTPQVHTLAIVQSLFAIWLVIT